MLFINYFMIISKNKNDVNYWIFFINCWYVFKNVYGVFYDLKVVVGGY